MIFGEKKKMNKLTTIFLTILVIVITFILVNNIFLPSYYSYQNACNQEKFNETKEKLGIVVAGKTTYNTTTKKNNITVTYQKDIDTIKHECVHVNQFYTRPQVLTCCNPLKKYFSEVEAYTGSYLPMGIYKNIYGSSCIDQLT